MTPADMALLHARSFTLPRPWSEAEIGALLQSPLCFVRMRPGGFVMGRVVADEAEVLTVAVDPAARQQGTGTALMAEFVTEAARRGAVSAFLEVAETNTAARALYARAGFTLQGRRVGYYRGQGGEIVDALVLSRAV